MIRVLALGLLLAGCAPKTGVIHSEQSPFQKLLVVDADQRRCLRFGDGPQALNQTCVRLDRPEYIDLAYARAVTTLAISWNPRPKRVLIIGLGGGAIPSALHRLDPAMHLEVVELDPAVIDIAKKYFSFSLEAHAGDGRAFLSNAVKRNTTWDLVVLDAFDEKGIAPGLFDAAALRDVRAVLAPGGVLLANTFGFAPSAEQELTDARAVFGHVEPLLVASNRIIIASDVELPTHEAMFSRASTSGLSRIGADQSWLRTWLARN